MESIERTKIPEILTKLYDVSDVIEEIINKTPVRKAEYLSNAVPTIFNMLSRPINQKSSLILRHYLRKYNVQGGIVLDAGVGYAHCSGEFARLGATVHGIDIDPYGMIASTIHLKYLMKARFCLFMGDLNECKLPIGYYDYFICTNVLEHLHNDELVLRKLFDCLISGGIGYISVPLHSDSFEPDTEPREVDLGDNKYKIYGHLREYDADRFKQLLKKIGFTILEEDLYSGTGGDNDPHTYNMLSLLVRG